MMKKRKVIAVACYIERKGRKTGPRFDVRRAVFAPVGMASSPLTA